MSIEKIIQKTKKKYDDMKPVEKGMEAKFAMNTLAPEKSDADIEKIKVEASLKAAKKKK